MWRDPAPEGTGRGGLEYAAKSGQEYAQSLRIAAVRGAITDLHYRWRCSPDIARQRDNEQQLRHMRHFDPLTQPSQPGAAAGRSPPEQAIAQVRRSGLPLHSAYIDLDGVPVSK